MTAETIGLGRILRLPEVKRETGLSRATIYRKIKAGDFPAPVELGGNSVGWYESEIAAWKANRPRRSAKPPKACGVATKTSGSSDPDTPSSR